MSFPSPALPENKRCQVPLETSVPEPLMIKYTKKQKIDLRAARLEEAAKKTEQAAAKTPPAEPGPAPVTLIQAISGVIQALEVLRGIVSLDTRVEM